MALRYVECPRDAWQGWAQIIPTEVKAAYLQRLLAAGLRSLDLGSFVSPRAVPQLADSEAVLARLQVPEDADLLGIIANERGLERALGAPQLTSVGFPLSVNETFQRRNTGRSLADAWALVETLLAGSSAGGLRLVVYLSMGFGNPYGEPWQPTDTARAVERLRGLGLRHIALADTVGTATAQTLEAVLAAIPDPQDLGLHLHARPDAWEDRLERALEHGLHWFEGALGGQGGCPFAGDALVGNLPSERVMPWLAARTGEHTADLEALPVLDRDAATLAERYG